MLIAFILAVFGGDALAQAPPSAPAAPPAQTAPPSKPHDDRCAPTEARPGDGTLSPRGEAGGRGGAGLSDKLARSDGVLCPPRNVDPEMHAPAPDAGTTPVIPPPGSPGGDPSVRPK